MTSLTPFRVSGQNRPQYQVSMSQWNTLLTAIENGINDAAATASAASATAIATAIAQSAPSPTSSTPAADLLFGETDGLAIDFTTTLEGRQVCKRVAGVDTEYGLAGFRAGLTWPAKSVTDATGATATTTNGDIPYDYSGSGVKAVLVENADEFTISQASFPTVKTLYFEFERTRIAGTIERPLVFTGGGDYLTLYLNATSTAPYVSVSASDGTTEGGAPGDAIASTSDDGVLCVTISMTAGKVAYSVNGAPPVAIPSIQEVTPTTLSFALHMDFVATHKLRFRRLVTTSREVPLSELPTWRYVPGSHQEQIVAGSSVRIMPDSTSTQREPVITVISETDSVCRYAVVHMDKNGPQSLLHGGNGEMPTRLRIQLREFNRDTLTDTPVTEESTVLYENAGWATGDGHNQSPNLLYSAARDRWELYWSRMNDSVAPGGNSYRDVYRLASTTISGLASATPEMVLAYTARSAGDGAGTHDYIVLDPAGTSAELASGKIIIPCYTQSDARCMIVATDGTCSLGNAWPSAGADGLPNESSVALLPDGSTAFFARMDDTNDRRGVYRSTDDGLTTTYLGTLTGYTGVGAAAGVAQTDPDGFYGEWGRIAIARPSTNSGYHIGIRVGFIEGPDLTLTDDTEILGGFRYTRYLATASIFGGQFLIIAFEYGPSANFNQWQHVGCMVVRTP